MVQLAPGALVVNHLRPYASWPDFRGLIESVVDAFRATTGVAPNPAQLGLRYINFLEPHDADLRMTSTLRVAPPNVGGLAREVLGYFQRYELRVDVPKGTLAHQTGTANGPNGKLGVMLDLDFVSRDPEVVGMAALVTWLNGAHEVVESTFVNSLTDTAYNRFKEGT